MDPAATQREVSTEDSPEADAPPSITRAWLAADAGFGLTRGRLLAGAGVVIVAALAAMVVGRQLLSGPASSPPKPAAPAPRPATAAPKAPVPDGFTRFDDPIRGLSISLPASWHRIPSADAELSLLATGDGASMLMRTAPLGIQIGPDDVGQARKITDNLLKAAGKVTIVSGPKRVSVGGLPGYLYLYTYRNAAGQQGAHAHYFLFRSNQTMLTIVFEVLPADRFAGLGPLFDRIAGTLRTADAASGQSASRPSPGAATAR